jgi:hypothetical protein
MEVRFKEAWSFRTPTTTIDYHPGPATVTSEVAKLAQAAGVLGDEPDPRVGGPLDQSVPELERYLASVQDVAHVNDLIDAEEAGKTRSTALASLRARRDELSGAAN